MSNGPVTVKPISICSGPSTIRQRKLGSEHADTAMTLLSIGRVRYFEARHTEAEKLFQQALTSLRKSLGPQHIQVAVALNNLAEVYKEQGRLALPKTISAKPWRSRKRSSASRASTSPRR